ncbi:MAG: hypothetical protein EBT37_08930 [Betaproteobacteria bacterium]|nr:hypothetical protein [Betaproteobacteria bacterium]
MKTLSMFKNTQQWMRGALSAGLVAVLLACGGGGVVPGTGVATRTLSPEFSSRKAVAYSPYRSSNRDTEVITDAMVLQDLQLLSAGGFKLIRLFDSSDECRRGGTRRGAGQELPVPRFGRQRG